MNRKDIVAFYDEPGKFLCLDVKRKKYYTVCDRQQMIYHEKLPYFNSDFVFVSPTGKYILFLSDCAKAVVHDVETGEIVYTYSADHEKLFSKAAFVNDDHLVFVLDGPDCLSNYYLLIRISDGSEKEIITLKDILSSSYRIVGESLAIFYRKRCDETFCLIKADLFTGSIKTLCDDFSFVPQQNIIESDSTIPAFPALSDLSDDFSSYLCFYRSVPFGKVSPCCVNWKEKTYKMLDSFPRKVLSVSSVGDSWIGWLSHDRIVAKLKDRVVVYSFPQVKRLAVCYNSNACVTVNDDGSICFYYSEDMQKQELSAYQVIKQIWESEYE